MEPDPILREKSLPVEKVDSDLQKLLNEMLETMYAAPGIGLAAVQIGILKRLIVIDISKEKEKKNPLFFNFINFILNSWACRLSKSRYIRFQTENSTGQSDNKTKKYKKFHIFISLLINRKLIISSFVHYTKTKVYRLLEIS